MTRRRGLALLLLALLACAPLAGAATREIRISFAGDCTLGGHEDWMSYRIGTFKVMAAEQGYAYFLAQALPVFGQDDLTVVNLEGVLQADSKGRNKQLKWNFRGDPAYTEILKLGSVEMVTLGNNHTRDFGAVGLQSTKEALDQAGILWCHEETASFYEKDGIRLAFLGYWGDDFRKAKPGFAAQVQQLKAQGAHAVILNYHGGQQYRQQHRQSQTEDMRYAIDCGVDLVIGHHPHVLQGMEIYQNRSIVYSLGDFCYGGNRKPRAVEYPTMILSVALRFGEAGYLSQQLTILPYRISGTAPRNNYQPLPADDRQAAEVMAIIQADTPYALAPYVPGQGAVQPELFLNGEGAR